jgi:hypothetical protein
MPDGGWLIEERYAGADPCRHSERRSSRLSLAADFTIRAGEYTIDSFVGKETATLGWSADGGYRLRHRAIDGFESEQVLPGAPRVPSERMVQSIVPLMARTKGATTVSALDAFGVDGIKIGAAEMTLTPSADEASPKEPRWKVQVSRLGQRAEQTFQMELNGRLRSLSETTVLLWPRELTPLDSTERNPPGVE